MKTFSQLYQDFSNHLVGLYSDNIPTTARFLAYSIKDESISNFLLKYGIKSELLEKDLNSLIKKTEKELSAMYNSRIYLRILGLNLKLLMLLKEV